MILPLLVEKILMYREMILYFVNECSIFRSYFPVEKGMAPHLKNNLNSFESRMFFAKFCIGTVVMEKNILQTDGRTDQQTHGAQVIRNIHLSFLDKK